MDDKRALYLQPPDGYVRIVSGYNLKSDEEANRIADAHFERTGQPVVRVLRAAVFSEGMHFHLYAKTRGINR